MERFTVNVQSIVIKISFCPQEVDKTLHHFVSKWLAGRNTKLLISTQKDQGFINLHLNWRS